MFDPSVTLKMALLYIYESPLMSSRLSPAGDAQASGRDRPADGENIGGESRPGPVLISGAESFGLCSGPKCGPPPLPALTGRLPVPLLTSRGQTSSTEGEREGALSLSSPGLCCWSELKMNVSELWYKRCICLK